MKRTPVTRLRPKNNYKQYLKDTKKMRILTFGPFNEHKRYIVVYNALCGAHAELDGRAELKLHGRCLDKIESIGEVINPDRGPNESAAFVCVAGGEVSVSEAEYQIIKRFLNAYIKNCVRILSREVDKALEWIDNVPEKLDEPKAPAAATATSGDAGATPSTP